MENRATLPLVESCLLRSLVILAIGLALAHPEPVHANAFRITDQSASGVGQGNAFAAQADDPSALFYNPAGITQLQDVQFSIGGLFLGGHTTSTGQTGGTTTGNFGGPIASPPPTNMYLTASLKGLDIHHLVRPRSTLPSPPRSESNTSIRIRPHSPLP